MRPGDRIWLRSQNGTRQYLVLSALCILVGLVVVLWIGRSLWTRQMRELDSRILVAIALLLFLRGLAAVVLYANRARVGAGAATIRRGAGAMQLILPANRALLHDSPAIDVSVKYADVAGIESRLEAYSAQRLAVMNRVTYLLRHAAEPRLLFEERGLRTLEDGAAMRKVIEEVAQRARVTLIDRGVQRAVGGVLMIWNVPPIDSSEPPLPDDIARETWETVRWSPTALQLLILVCVVLRMLGYILRDVCGRV